MNAIYYNNFDNSYIPHILKEIYIERIYDQFFAGRKDMTVLDIGGNIGLFTMYAVPHSKIIYTLEPSKEHFEVLQKNVKENKWGNVKTIRKALFMRDEDMTFYHNSNTTMYSLNKDVAQPELGTEIVKAVTLETLFKENNIKHVDFMKLDIEGAEVDVVGSQGFQSAVNKIDAMVVEYHTWSGRHPTQLTTTLRDYGFDVFAIKADATLVGARKRK